MQEYLASGRSVTKVSAFFFATLSMIALLSPLGATHDEAFHVRNIWCGHGEREEYCTERFRDEEGGLVVRTNIEIQNCQASSSVPLLCPTSRVGESVSRANDGLYPPVFYYILSWFVVPSVSVSTVLVRLASALIISLVFGSLLWLLPHRHRVVLLLVALTAFSPTGYFLFASMNPSSWTSFGVGVGWIALHAALVDSNTSRTRKVALMSVSIVAWTMAIGSRFDGISFVAFSAILTVVHAISLRKQWDTKKILGTVVLTTSVGWVILEKFSQFSPTKYLKLLYTYSDGQRDNVSFFSENLLQGLPNTLRALGTVPSKSPIHLPDVVFVVGILLLGFFILQTYRRRERAQLIGALATVMIISLVMMAQIAQEDGRDSGGLEPRYTYPLLLVLVGWWYLVSSVDALKQLERYLRPASVVATAVFSLSVFTIAERFVDRQTYGLRYLPESPDQWWWSWMPAGPNVVVALASVFLWNFFSQLRKVVGDSLQESRQE